ncbi:endonuclease [Bombiscardovia apis]|uniref:Endonuclease n=1 Tax=Bombiscardovia apis TaxID=2932182 RepID=A0ABN6SHW8_9BIFI|nr:endonuclease/exonuclease/phosphatase family protein [Bombiscardovia apis]BDR54190.1 endonuclease [Bombiscardovia apis]
MSTLLWTFLVLCALWMALRFLPTGWDWHRPLPELIALIPLLAGPLMALTLWALLAAAWPQLILAVLLLTLEAIWQLPFLLRLPPRLLRSVVGLPVFSQSAPQNSESELQKSLRFMTLNCRYGKASAAAIVEAARQQNLDVLALQELSAELVASLESEGLSQVLPYKIVGPSTADDNGGFNALFSRIEPRVQQPVSVTLPASAVPVMTLEALGKTIEVASAHPKSPQRGGSNWGASILALTSLSPVAPLDPEQAHLSPQVPAERESVILGDLNSSIHHPSFRRLLSDGRLLDGAVSLHAGIHPTFPASWKALPPLIEIDHLLHSPGLRVRAMKSLLIPGSDHMALTATLLSSHS